MESYFVKLWENLDNLEETILHLQNFHFEILTTAPWFYYPIKYFDQNSLNYLYQNFTSEYGFEPSGKKVKIPTQLRFDILDLFLFLIHLKEESIDSFLKAEKSAEFIYGSLDINFYETLKAQIETLPEGGICNFLETIKDRIIKRSDYAKVPDYMIQIKNIDKKLKDELKFTNQYILKLEKLEENTQLDILARPERKEEIYKDYILAKYREQLGKVPILDRLFGPANRQPNLNLSNTSICSIFGGCRMFLCDCLDPFEWFSGHCDICLKRIKKINYALRLPRIGGSWSGCYCSFECLESDITEKNFVLDDYIELDEVELYKYESSKFPKLFVNIFKTIILKGIEESDFIMKFDYTL